MSDQDDPDGGSLVPTRRSDLEPVAAVNPLVSRGIMDLAKCHTRAVFEVKDDEETYLTKIMMKLRMVSKQLLQTTGHEPSFEAIAEVAGISIVEARRVLGLAQFSAAVQQIAGDRIVDVLNTLPFREREIIKLRFGLGDGFVYTRAEVGRVFKLPSESVGEIEDKAIRRLRHPVRLRQLREAHDMILDMLADADVPNLRQLPVEKLLSRVSTTEG